MKVQAFWHGKLGTMERMCLNSYVRTGHPVDLYLYRAPTTEEYEWLPLGVTVKDANEILPESRIADFPWASIFSDFFRYALLRAKGGWWVDMDTLCLRPFDDLDGDEHIFAQDNIPQYYISGCFLKAPLGSQLIEAAYASIEGLDKAGLDKLGHMDIGPNLLQKLVPAYGLEKYVVPKHTFDPIPWDKITQIVRPEFTVPLEIDMLRHQPHAIHLRQSIWNEGPNSCAGILPDGSKIMIDGKYPEDSLWEILKRRFL